MSAPGTAVSSQSCGIWNKNECVVAKETIVALIAIASVVALLISIGMVLAANGVPMGPVNAMVTTHVTEQIIYASLIASFFAMTISVTLLFLIAQSNRNKQIPAKEMEQRKGADREQPNPYERLKADKIDVKLYPGQYWARVDSGVPGLYGPAFYAVKKDWDHQAGVVAFRSESDLETYLYRLDYQDGKAFFEASDELPIAYVHSIHGEDFLEEYERYGGPLMDLKMNEQVTFPTGLDDVGDPSWVLVTRDPKGLEVRYFKSQQGCEQAMNERKYAHCLPQEAVAEELATNPIYAQYRAYLQEMVRDPSNRSFYFVHVQPLQKPNGVVANLRTVFWVRPDGTIDERSSLAEHEIANLILSTRGMNSINPPTQNDLQQVVQQQKFYRQQVGLYLNEQINNYVQMFRLEELLTEENDAYLFDIPIPNSNDVYEAIAWRKANDEFTSQVFLRGSEENRQAFLDAESDDGRDFTIANNFFKQGYIEKEAIERLIPAKMNQQAYADACAYYNVPRSFVSGDYLRLPPLNTGILLHPSADPSDPASYQHVYPLACKPGKNTEVGYQYFTSPEARENLISEQILQTQDTHDLAEKHDTVLKLGALIFQKREDEHTNSGGPPVPTALALNASEIFKTNDHESRQQFFLITRDNTTKEIKVDLNGVSPTKKKDADNVFMDDVAPAGTEIIGCAECRDIVGHMIAANMDQLEAHLYGNQGKQGVLPKQHYAIATCSKNDRLPDISVLFVRNDQGNTQFPQCFFDPVLLNEETTELENHDYVRFY